MFAVATLVFSPTSLTSFDWFLAGLAAVSTLLAFRKGIIRVLFSLAGVVAGTVLAAWNYVHLAGWLGRWIVSLPAAEIAAFLAILVGVMMAASLLGAIVRRSARAAGLGFLDRLLGAAFGLVRGVLLGVAAMLAIAAFFPRSGWVKNSVLAPYFLGGAHAVSFVVPQGLKERVSAGRRALLEQTPGLFKPSHMEP